MTATSDSRPARAPKTASKPAAKGAPAKKATAAKAAKAPKSAAKPVPKAASKAVVKKPAVKTVEKPADKSRLKLVRDGFTMPQLDFDLIAVLKKRAITLHRPAKKSELLRAGLHALHTLPDESLLAALEGLVQLKLGRPKKGG